MNRVILEDQILASVLTESTRDNKSGLSDEMLYHLDECNFSDDCNVDIFRAIQRARDNGETADIVAVSNYCSKPKSLDKISILTSSTATTSKIDTLIDNIVGVTKHQNTLSAIGKATEVLLSACNVSDVPHTLDEAEALLSKVFSYGRKIQEKNSGELKAFLSDYFHSKMEQVKGNVPLGEPSGIPTYDEMTGGFRGGELIIVAGLPGMGKTTFALTVMSHNILAGKAPAIFSLEMDDEEILDKIMAIISFLRSDGISIDYNCLRNPQYLSESEKDEIQIISGMIHQSNAYLNIDPCISLQQIKSESRRLKADGKLTMLIVDYCQLMIVDQNKYKEEVSQITRELKLLAKELNVPVILLSQLNKRDATVGERPHKGWLKGSGSLEANATVILFPWREFAIKEEGDASKSTLIKGKHRHWKGRDIDMVFCQKTTAFYESVDREESF